MPAPQRVTSTSPPIKDNRHSTPPIAQRAPPAAGGTTGHSFAPTLEEASEDGSDIGDEQPHSPASGKGGLHGDDGTSEEDGSDQEGKQGRARKGTMSKNFKFPPESGDAPPSPPPPVPSLPSQPAPKQKSKSAHTSTETQEVSLTAVPDKRGGVLTPSSVEVPPPPPVEKERSPGVVDGIGFDDLGETEEISLN